MPLGAMFDLTLTLRASGRADVETAWGRYAAFDQWPSWSPQIRAVDADAARIAPGVTGKVVGPLGVALEFVVDEVDELARTWSWRVRRGPLTVRLWHGVDADAGGCSTSLRIRGPAPVVVGYAPVARIALGRLVAP